MVDASPGIPRLLTQEEAAEALRMSVRQLQRLRAARKIAFLPGRPVKLTEAAVRRYIEAVAEQAAAPPPAKNTKVAPQPPAPLTGAQRGRRMLLTQQMRNAAKSRP